MDPRKPAAGARVPTPDLLLHTAECLFAEQGIAAVSNRRVAEVAGAANNSAVHYHFGTKAELLLAIVRKHNTAVEEIRQRMLAEVAGSDDPRDYIGCLILPLTEHLRRLGPPTWYARFALQAMTEPSFSAVFTEEAAASPGNRLVTARLSELITGREREVLKYRGQLVGLVICHACAGYEREEHRGTPRPGGSWESVGRFLVDAVSGMLLAPVTSAPV